MTKSGASSEPDRQFLRAFFGRHWLRIDSFSVATINRATISVAHDINPAFAAARSTKPHLILIVSRISSAKPCLSSKIVAISDNT